MFVNSKDERDNLHKIEREYDIITVSYKGKWKQSVRINNVYKTDVWSAVKSFLTTPISKIGTKEVEYKLIRASVETEQEEDQQ